MTKSELVEQLSIELKHHLLSYQDAQYGLDVLLDGMADALSFGERIEVRGFGSFRLNHHEAHIGRNPKTGSVVHVPDKHIPHFKPSQELRQRVDNHS